MAPAALEGPRFGDGPVSLEVSDVLPWEMPVPVTEEQVPSWFDEPAQMALAADLQALVDSVQLTLAAEMTANLLLADGGDPRSDHIAKACGGAKAAYHGTVLTFAATAATTVGFIFARKPVQAWNYYKATGAALVAANVARAELNACEYREGFAWDQAHPNG